MQQLIKHIPLRNNPDVMPYQKADIEIYGIEPKGLRLGQRFALESKLIDIIKNLDNLLSRKFYTKGISKMPPAQIF